MNFGTTYYARVQAVDAGGLAGAYSSTDTETTGTPPLTPLSDGNPPASSPTPVVVGGIGYLHVSWSAITNNDLVTYEVHLSTTSGVPSPGTGTKAAEIMGTAVVLERTPAGVNLAYGTTYYVKIIAKDADGAAVIGAQASGTPLKALIGDVSITPGDIGSSTTIEMNAAILGSANGKNKVTYTTIAPTVTDANIAGDTWFVRNAVTGVVSAQYEGTGGTAGAYTWTQKTLDSAVIAALDAGKITTGTLDALRIGANSIRTKHLAVGGDNLVSDSSFESGDFNAHNIASSATLVRAFDTVTKKSGLQSLKHTVGVAFTGGIQNILTHGSATDSTLHPRAAPGDTWRFSFWARSNTGNTIQARPAVLFRKTSDPTTAVHSGTGNYITLTTTWTLYSMEKLIPTTETEELYVMGQVAVQNGSLGDVVYVDDLELRKRLDGTLLVDGTVAANKITAGTFTGGTFIVGTGGILRTAGSEVTLTSSGITVTGTSSSIQADAIVSGNIIATAALTVNGTLTVANSGWVQSTGYTTGGTSGYRLSATGLDVKAGTINAGAIVTGNIGAAGAAGLTLTNGSYIQLTSGYIKGGGYVGTVYSSTASAGFYFGNDGLRIATGNISISGGAISGDTISGTNFTVNSGGSITGTGFTLSSAGLTISSGTIGGVTIESNQIRSSNYDNVGPTYGGWMINSTGAVFNNVTVRGTLEGVTGSFTGTLGTYGDAGEAIKFVAPGAGTGWDYPYVGVEFDSNQTVNGYIYGSGSTLQMTNPYSGASSTNMARLVIWTGGVEISGAGIFRPLTGIQNYVPNELAISNIKSGKKTIGSGWSGANPVVQTVTVSAAITTGGYAGTERSAVATIYGANAENWDVSVMNQTSTGFDLRVRRLAGSGTSVDVNWILTSQ